MKLTGKQITAYVYDYFDVTDKDIISIEEDETVFRYGGHILSAGWNENFRNFIVWNGQGGSKYKEYLRVYFTRTNPIRYKIELDLREELE